MNTGYEHGSFESTYYYNCYKDYSGNNLYESVNSVNSNAKFMWIIYSKVSEVKGRYHSKK